METVFRNLQIVDGLIDIKVDEKFIEIFVKNSAEKVIFYHSDFEKLKAIVQVHHDKQDTLEEKINQIEAHLADLKGRVLALRGYL